MDKYPLKLIENNENKNARIETTFPSIFNN